MRTRCNGCGSLHNEHYCPICESARDDSEAGTWPETHTKPTKPKAEPPTWFALLFVLVFGFIGGLMTGISLASHK